MEKLVVPSKGREALAAEAAGLAVEVVATADTTAGAVTCRHPASHTGCPMSVCSVPCHPALVKAQPSLFTCVQPTHT